MSKGTKTNLKKNIVNFFGALGYLLCSLQWLFVVVVYSNFIKELLVADRTVVEQHVPQPSPLAVSVHTDSNLALIILIAVIVVGVVALSAYLLIKIPKTIVTTSTKVVHVAAEHAAPVVLRMQHVQEREQTPKRLRRVTSYLIATLKVLFIAAPLILAFCGQFTSNQALNFTMTMYGSIALAGATTLFFILQFVLARILRVPRQDLW